MKLDIKQVTQLFFKRKQYTYDKLNEIMERTLEIKNFTEGKRRLTMEQMEIVIGLLDVLTNEGESNDENNNEQSKTDSGIAPVQEPDGNQSEELEGLRSVSQVQDSPAVSNFEEQPDFPDNQ